jgi:hypothetical protein
MVVDASSLLLLLLLLMIIRIFQSAHVYEIMKNEKEKKEESRRLKTNSEDKNLTK